MLNGYNPQFLPLHLFQQPQGLRVVLNLVVGRPVVQNDAQSRLRTVLNDSHSSFSSLEDLPATPHRQQLWQKHQLNND